VIDKRERFIPLFFFFRKIKGLVNIFLLMMDGVRWFRYAHHLPPLTFIEDDITLTGRSRMSPLRYAIPESLNTRDGGWRGLSLSSLFQKE